MIEVTATGSVSADTAAMQDALSQGGHILMDEHLQVLTPLRLVERTRLTIGPRGVLERAGAAGLLRNRWDGDNFGGYSGRGQIVIDGGGTLEMAGHLPGDTALPASALTIAHADNVTIRDVTIRNVPGAHGVDLIGCRNVRIERVTFAGFLADPADSQPRESIQIDGAYGTYSGDSAPADSTPCDDVLIEGCRFEASGLLPAPQRAVGSHGYADDVAGHEHRGIRVVDCAMDGLTDSAVYAWKWSRSTIARNIITGPALNGIVLKDGTWDTDVLHNHVYDAGHSGVWVNGCHNFAVHRNRIIGASAEAHDTHYGIRVDGGCATAEITDNRVRRRGHGNEARYGLSFTSGQVRMVHHGNYLVWSGISGSLQDDSTSPTTSAGDAL